MEGEKKNTIRILQQVGEKKTGKKVLINGRECKGNKITEKEVFMFYSNLYSSMYSPIDSTNFFDQIQTTNQTSMIHLKKFVIWIKK